MCKLNTIYWYGLTSVFNGNNFYNVDCVYSKFNLTKNNYKRGCRGKKKKQ